MPESRHLIFLAVFDWSVVGKLTPAPCSRLFDTVENALQEAKLIADRHAGVMVWTRLADPYLGEYGPPKVLFQSGNVPDLE